MDIRYYYIPSNPERYQYIMQIIDSQVPGTDLPAEIANQLRSNGLKESG